MKYNNIICSFLFLVIPCCMNAQSKNRRNDNVDRLLPKVMVMADSRIDSDEDNNSSTIVAPRTKKGGGVSRTITEKVIPDTILCWSIVKKNGWYTRLGEVKTLEEMSHTSLTWRLTNPDEHGIYRKVEAINSYGKHTTNHRLGTYISMQDDEEEMGGNTDWQQRIGQSCIWRCETDDDGTILQESAYDSQNNLIYTYTPIQVSPNRWVGTYTDRYGHPINLRADSTLTTMVAITLDENGHEKLAELLTADGAPAKNRNRVYQWRFEFDKDGYELRQWSADIFGNPVIDNATNCGTASTKWDKKRGNWLITYSFGQDFMPLRLYKNNPEKADDSYIEVHDTYDKWGRLIYRDFYDGYGHRDSLLNGVSRQCFEYNDAGQTTCYYSLDITGQPISPYPGGVGYYQIWQYDSIGREVLWEMLDKDRRTLVGVPTWFVERKTEYDKKGDILKQYQYLADDKGHIKLYYCQLPDNKTGGQRIVWYDDGIQVKTLDKEEGYHSNITTYKTMGRVLEEKDYYLNTEGELVKIGKYAKNITRRDSVKCIEIIKLINPDGSIDDSYMKGYTDSTLTRLQFQASLNASEKMGIRGNRNGTYYFKAGTNMTDDEERVSGIFGYNEWDDPCYVSDSRRTFYYQRMNASKYPDKFYDEDFNEIDDMTSFVKQLPYAFIIEVTDSSGYNLGLKDGDVILRYGNCLINDSTMKKCNEVDFYMENYLMASQSKPIFIMRHYPKDNTSKLIRIDLPKGKMSDMGFVFHKIPYTRREVERYVRFCESNWNQFGFDKHEKAKNQLRDIVLFVPQKYSTSDPDCFYNQGMKDPMLLVRIYSGEKYWDLNQPLHNYFGWRDEVKDTYFELLGSAEDSITILSSYEVQLYSKNVQSYLATIDLKEIQKIQNMTSLSLNPKILKKDLIGTWQSLEQLEDHTEDVTIQYNKNGKASISFNIEFDGITIPVKFIADSWKIKGNKACFNFKEEDIIYESITYAGSENDQNKTQLLSYIEAIKEGLIRSTSFMKLLNGKEVYIEKLSSGNIQLSNPNACLIFKKQ